MLLIICNYWYLIYLIFNIKRSADNPAIMGYWLCIIHSLSNLTFHRKCQVIVVFTCPVLNISGLIVQHKTHLGFSSRQCSFKERFLFWCGSCRLNRHQRDGNFTIKH